MLDTCRLASYEPKGKEKQAMKPARTGGILTHSSLNGSSTLHALQNRPNG